MNEGYIMLRRGDAARELLRDANAFILLAVIALRAKQTSGFSVHGLEIGQALIGDFKAYGLTEGQYRAAKVRLKRYGLADFKGTNKGTVATLLNNAIIDINVETSQRTDDEPTTGRERIGDGQTTATGNDKNERSDAPPAEAKQPTTSRSDVIHEGKTDFYQPREGTRETVAGVEPEGELQ